MAQTGGAGRSSLRQSRPARHSVSKRVAVRFGVSDPLGRCSSVWRLWAEGRGGDVYVAARPVIKAVKVSLHASREYREAFNKPYAAANQIPDAERVRAKWSRLEPADGWIYAYRIKVPASELRPVDTPHIPDDTYWHPAPPEDGTTEFTILIGPHELEQRSFPGGGVGALFVMGLTAGNGDRVALMVHETSSTRESRTDLERMRRRAVSVMRADGRQGWYNQRAIVPIVDKYGVGTAVELAIPDDLASSSPR